MIFRFTIDSPLYGYRASVAAAHAPEYSAFKAKVRWLANSARVPHAIFPGDDVRVRVVIFWNKAARIDGKNVYAAIEDGLFKQDRGMASGSWVRFENIGREEARVLVEVTEHRPRSRRDMIQEEGY